MPQPQCKTVRSAVSKSVTANMVTRVVFVTGNSNKLREVVAILGRIPGFELENHALDVPELQGDSDAICRAKCEAASQQVGGAVLIEDTSLGFDALGGLPGPYVKWFLHNIGSDGLHRMLTVGAPLLDFALNGSQFSV